MGFSVCVSAIDTMFKSLVATCLVAAAQAQLVAHVPFGSSTGLDPITQGLDASTQGYLPYAHLGYGHHALGYGHHAFAYGKRSADAQLVAHVPFGSSTGLDPITQGLDASTQGYLPYAHLGYGHHALGYGHHAF